MMLAKVGFRSEVCYVSGMERGVGGTKCFHGDGMAYMANYGMSSAARNTGV